MSVSVFTSLDKQAYLPGDTVEVVIEVFDTSEDPERRSSIKKLVFIASGTERSDVNHIKRLLPSSDAHETSTGKKRVRTIFSTGEELLIQDVDIRPKGLYKFLVSFKLPSVLPPTYKGAYVSFQYTVTARATYETTEVIAKPPVSVSRLGWVRTPPSALQQDAITSSQLLVLLGRPAPSVGSRPSSPLASQISTGRQKPQPRSPPQGPAPGSRNPSSPSPSVTAGHGSQNTVVPRESVAAAAREDNSPVEAVQSRARCGSSPPPPRIVPIDRQQTCSSGRAAASPIPVLSIPFIKGREWASGAVSYVVPTAAPSVAGGAVVVPPDAPASPYGPYVVAATPSYGAYVSPPSVLPSPLAFVSYELQQRVILASRQQIFPRPRGNLGGERRAAALEKGGKALSAPRDDASITSAKENGGAARCSVPLSTIAAEGGGLSFFSGEARENCPRDTADGHRSPPGGTETRRADDAASGPPCISASMEQQRRDGWSVRHSPLRGVSKASEGTAEGSLNSPQMPPPPRSQASNAGEGERGAAAAAGLTSPSLTRPAPSSPFTKTFLMNWGDAPLVKLALQGPLDCPLLPGTALGGTLYFASPSLPSSSTAAASPAQRVHHVTAVLETEEVVAPACLTPAPGPERASPESSSSLVSRSSVAEFRETVSCVSCCGFQLSLPPSAPRSFATPMVAVRWRIRVELLVAPVVEFWERSRSLGGDAGQSFGGGPRFGSGSDGVQGAEALRFPGKLKFERLEWSLPLVV